MDAREMRNLEQLLVSCFENRMKIRTIGDNKEYECKTKEEIDSKKIVGVYTLRMGTFYSVLRFQDNIFFIINNRIFNVFENRIEFSCITKDTENRIFKVTVNDNLIHTIKYSRFKAIEDNWSSEDDLDFFSWISNIYKKGRLDKILRY